MRRVLAVAAVFVALGTGCGGDDEEYPEESVESFVESCAAQPNTTEAACRCVIERLQETMPYEEFQAADRAVQEEKPLKPESRRKLERAAAACR